MCLYHTVLVLIVRFEITPYCCVVTNKILDAVFVWPDPSNVIVFLHGMGAHPPFWLLVRNYC